MAPVKYFLYTTTAPRGYQKISLGLDNQTVLYDVFELRTHGEKHGS